MKNGALTQKENHKAVAVVRQLTAAFRQVANFEPFVSALEAALGKAEFFDQAAVSLFPRLPEEEQEGRCIPASTLCLPLPGDGRTLGMLAFSDAKKEFGPHDLHLMSGLAELMAVLAEHALRYGEQRRNLALLGFLLNQVPVGILCYDDTGRVLVSNTPGRRLAGKTGADGEEWALPEVWLEEAGRRNGAFHLHVAGKLVQAVPQTVGPAEGERVRALVLADLTPETEKFRDALAREMYRCAWLKKAVSLVLLHAREVAPLMASLPGLRERFGPPAVVAPCDSQTVGILLPDLGLAGAMERLRKARRLLGSEWEAGVAVSSLDLQHPEVLIAAAFGGRRRVKDFLRRNLLLHDDYASVNDMLEMVLRDQFRVTKSCDFGASLRHLQTGAFDGLVTEIELRNGAGGWDLAQAARAFSPSLRPFFTSPAAMARRQDPRFTGEHVFQKPFNVAEVRLTVAAAFAE